MLLRMLLTVQCSGGWPSVYNAWIEMHSVCHVWRLELAVAKFCWEMILIYSNLIKNDLIKKQIQGDFGLLWIRLDFGLDFGFLRFFLS